MPTALVPDRALDDRGDHGDAGAHLEAIRRLEASVALAIRGKPEAVRLALVALIARGHLLIEDVPGVGKTTLARALARSVGGNFRRIQFTSDLLPSDILGVTVYDQGTSRFDFRPGPIFANVVLADEINRTTPRTQSALLEAMSDGHVSIDDKTHVLDQPFLVIATQNPTEHYGTYPLPESQLDRFLLRIRIGYPAHDDEREVLRRAGEGDPLETMKPVVDLATVRALQARATRVALHDRLIDYAMAVVAETRRAPGISLGVSTRGVLGWTRAAQAAALVAGRDYVVPDDLKGLAVAALAHRIQLAGESVSAGRGREEAERVLAELLERVPVPAR